MISSIVMCLIGFWPVPHSGQRGLFYVFEWPFALLQGHSFFVKHSFIYLQSHDYLVKYSFSVLQGCDCFVRYLFAALQGHDYFVKRLLAALQGCDYFVNHPLAIAKVSNRFFENDNQFRGVFGKRQEFCSGENLGKPSGGWCLEGFWCGFVFRRKVGVLSKKEKCCSPYCTIGQQPCCAFQGKVAG